MFALQPRKYKHLHHPTGSEMAQTRWPTWTLPQLQIHVKPVSKNNSTCDYYHPRKPHIRLQVFESSSKQLPVTSQTSPAQHPMNATLFYISHRHAGPNTLNAHFGCVWTFTKHLSMHMWAPAQVVQRNRVFLLQTMHRRHNWGLKLL